MNTVIKSIDPENIDDKIIDEFGKMLREGKTVIFPTETVYGLGANALDEKAASNIYKAKGRPSDNPLLVHVSEKHEVYELVENVSEDAQKLMDKFWPGPLTIVFKKKNIIPDRTSGGLDTVAIRMPSDEIARRLIKAAGVPIAAPSANISGKPSPTKPSHIISDMSGRVDGIITAGQSNYGVESTIVDLSSDTAYVLRPGSITIEMLREVLDNVELDPCLEKGEDNIKAKAPGMKYKHYSPDAEIFIVKGKEDKVVRKIKKCIADNTIQNKKCAVLCLECNVKKYSNLDSAEVISFGKNEKEAAKNLFDILIKLDSMGIDIAYAEAFEEKELGVAIMNRLKKSAGYKIIEV